MTGELLLELLSEEIPARMQRRAIDDLTALVRDKLKAADIPAATIEGHVTPRRLVVIADGIPARQPDRSEERRGPRVGAPEQAINGFLRSAGLKSPDELEVRGEFHFAVIKRPGRATQEVLAELILAAMTALPWPKSMRYPGSSLRWVRPLNSVVCLFDGEVINLPLGEVPVGRVTQGHRFLAPGEITVESAADYRAKLAEAHVVLDRQERRVTIDEELTALARAAGLTVKADEGLLDEVTGLVEYPVVLMGKIDADFVRPLPDGLPPEVLATAMRTHQKYFTCLNPDGTPAPRFLFVANNVTPDGGKTIAAGNERVLRARLSDARFFWDQDRKTRLEDRVEALKQRVYHEGIGSEYDRRQSLASITADISSLTGSDEEIKTISVAAAQLANADLCTGTVGEFPELQGIVGGYLVLHAGRDPRIADAIAQQYRPLGPNDGLPTKPASINLALAAKINALVSFFKIGEKPTGSRDPYALRRIALGIVRTILENKVRLRLTVALIRAASIYTDDTLKVTTEVMDFIAERLKIHLREKGVRHDLISAVFALHEDDLVRLLNRVEALQTFLKTDDGINLLIAYRRASNIVDIEEQRDGRRYDGEVTGDLLSQEEERTLHDRLTTMSARVEDQLSQEFFESAMIALATLRKPVDEFFERVTVNVEDKKLRENRLRLLARIRATMNQIADFSQIEG
ncbi:MAG TPA: glycine--tRNA ligase subunit beta [Stellaceae bacterium]|nr:glycine--tRNA ligase subunit beta [Stellaceae bacterium]